MDVYRISQVKYSKKLIASGMPNRWNKENEYVIYTSGSRALCILEMVAHRSSKMKKKNFKLLTIKLPNDKKYFKRISKKKLPKTWKSLRSYNTLQNIGSDWYVKKESLILVVPSVLVEDEFNYIINTNHPDFESKIKEWSKVNFK